jgi:hypothetical protein
LLSRVLFSFQLSHFWNLHLWFLGVFFVPSKCNPFGWKLSFLVVFFPSTTNLYEWHLSLFEHFNPQITTLLDENCAFKGFFCSSQT